MLQNNAFWFEKRGSNISEDDAEVFSVTDWKKCASVHRRCRHYVKKGGTTLIEDLKATFDNLDKFCLKLNPTKCSFGVPAGELLGFLVSARVIEANPEKIQAIVTDKGWPDLLSKQRW